MTYQFDPKAINFAVSDEEQETFQRDGVVALRGALSAKEITSLKEAATKQLSELRTSPSAYDFQELGAQMWRKEGGFNTHGATRFDMEYYYSIVNADKDARPLIDDPMGSLEEPGKFFYDAAGWRRFKAIQEVALDSNLPEAAAILMGSSYINFWEDTTFIKTAGATQRTAFHQDKAYFQITGNKCCIMWIALDRADASTGAMEYIRGSHKWQREFAPNVFFTQTAFPDSDGSKLPDIEANRNDYDIVRIDAEPGDVIVHHVLTVHGAGGNKTQDADRMAISLRYCGDDIRYFNRPGAIPQLGLQYKHKNGDVLYSVDYPRVFPRPYPGAKISALFDAAD